jgi:UDP-glucose 4-epimerase
MLPGYFGRLAVGAADTLPLMRAFVTGCAGFIGSHLSESLLADGHEVLGVDCFNDNYGRAEKLANLHRSRDWDAFEFVPIDLARGELRSMLAECDVVFHLAAEPGVRASWGSRYEAYVRNNILATQHLLEAARLEPGRRIVYASSSSIYGDAERLPTPEDVTPAPRSPYGATKLHGEHLIAAYAADFGVEAVSLRFFTVYGPRQRPDMAFTIFCRRLLADEPLELYGGEQTRDFTYVADIVAATRAAAITREAVGRFLNVGGGSRVGLREAVAALADVSGMRPRTEVRDVQHGDVRHTAADISEARRVLGYEPRTALDEGLAAQWEWAVRSSEAPVA